MGKELPQPVLDYLGSEKTVTLATASPNGVPHASTFMYVNDGVELYIWVRPGSMTAEHIQPASDPGRSPAAIRDALPAADRAEFARSYAAALEEARRTWSLQPVDAALEQWRRIAVLAREPKHRAALDDGLQLLAGGDVALYPLDAGALEALRRGELPADRERDPRTPARGLDEHRAARVLGLPLNRFFGLDSRDPDLAELTKVAAQRGRIA